MKSATNLADRSGHEFFALRSTTNSRAMGLYAETPKSWSYFERGRTPKLGKLSAALPISVSPKSYLESRSLISDARARLRIMDSNETRGTSISLRISAVLSRRWVALGMRDAARSKAPDDAAYMPAIAR